MQDFGRRLKALRKEKGYTREAICGDESELSVRQLSRIESGQSLPTIAKVSFLAKQLHISFSALAGEEIRELPKRYQELKYFLLRTPTYQDEKRIEQAKTYLEEIHRAYFNQLPEEEQLAIKLIQSTLTAHASQRIDFANSLFQDYFQQTLLKEVYTGNDLLVLGLYFITIVMNGPDSEAYSAKLLKKLLKRLLDQIESFLPNHLFLLRDSLLQCAAVVMLIGDYKTLSQIITGLYTISSITQDYQKQALLHMLEWKYCLFFTRDKVTAEEKYHEAILFSQLIHDPILKTKLQEEWTADLKKD